MLFVRFSYIFYDTFITNEITILLSSGCLHPSQVRWKKSNPVLIFVISGNHLEIMPNKINAEFEN